MQARGNTIFFKETGKGDAGSVLYEGGQQSVPCSVSDPDPYRTGFVFNGLLDSDPENLFKKLKTTKSIIQLEAIYFKSLLFASY